MNTISKLAAVLSFAALLSPLALSASPISSDEAYVESYQGRSGIPVPISVVSPSYQGTTGVVEVAFVVNEKGKPTNIALMSGMPASSSALSNADRRSAATPWPNVTMTSSGMPRNPIF